MVSRLRILGVTLWIVMGLVVSSYWVVQGVHGARYAKLAEHNRLRRLPVVAPRGLVTDVEDRPLIDNVPSYTLLLHQRRARDLDRSLDFAAEIVGRPRDELSAVVEAAEPSAIKPVLLAESLTLAQVARVELALYEHPEFEIAVEHLRLYRHREQTAHLLGYLGELGPELAGDEAYLAGDLVGKGGVEQRYERELRGRHGEQMVIVDNRGRTVEEYGYEPARPGARLTLTLDLDLQQTAYRMLADRVGAVVAIDPRSGAVRVMVSSPSYDPNLFARRLDDESWRRLLDAPHQPLQNRTIQNTHPPGSIFKPVMALAALNERVVTTEDRVWCGGSATFYNHRFRCWKRGGHGWVDLHDALRESCDVYFYQLGQRMNIDTIADYSRRFGFGRRTGIDLEGEKPGLVPDVAWSLGTRGHPWYPGETISVAIGQGPVLVTPLQAAVMMAAIATEGTLPTPSVVLDRRPGSAGRVELPASVWAPVKRALEAVVDGEGTGRRAAVRGLSIAGKTGTVQVVSQSTWGGQEELPFEQRDHAWFVSYAPADAPELVVVVFVEHGGAGSRSAAPIARAIYEEYLEKRPDLRRLPPA